MRTRTLWLNGFLLLALLLPGAGYPTLAALPETVDAPLGDLEFLPTPTGPGEEELLRRQSRDTYVAQKLAAEAQLPAALSMEGELAAHLFRSSSTSANIPTAGAENVEFVGHIGGNTNAVAMQGDYVYVGEGPRLTILNISIPTTPVLVGKTAPFLGVIEDVHVSGNFAYVAASDGGLRVVDISDPTSPTEIGACDTPGYAQGVYVSGGTAYVADGSAGLRVVDVSDPAHPTEVGYYDTPGYPVKVAISGEIAYLAEWGGGLRMIDISGSATPTEVGYYAMPEYTYDVAVNGDIAYVVGGSCYLDCAGWMRVIDVGNPVSSIEISHHAVPWPARSINISRGIAYIAAAELRVVDVSDPASPIELGVCDVQGYASDVVVSEGNAYVATSYWGLRVVDVTNPSNLTEIGIYDIQGYANSTALREDTAHVLNWLTGLLSIDVSHHASLSKVGFYDAPWHAEDVVITENIAYIVDWGGLRIVDIGDPVNPTEIGHYDTWWWGAKGLAVCGDFAYIAADDWGLQVWDVSNPASPTEVGLYAMPGYAYDVSISEGIAYVSGNTGSPDYDGWLRVVDVSVPTCPTEIGFYDTPGRAYDVAASEGYAYVADGSAGLRVVDVSASAHPTEVGYYDTPGWAEDVTVVGDYAYVADGSAGLRVVDVSDPTNPTEVGSYDTPGSARGVSVSEGYVYVADWVGGLIILRYGGAEITPAPVSLALSLEEWIHPAASLQVGLWLHSEAPTLITYTVHVTLSQDGQTPIVREETLSASEAVSPYLSFDFGTRAAGSYNVLAEVFQDETVLASQTGHTEVLSSTDAAQALTAAAELTRAAHWEFNEGQEIVVEAYGESISGIPAEVVGFFMDKLLGLVSPVGEAALVPNEEIVTAGYELTTKIFGLDRLIEAMTRPAIESQAHHETDIYLNHRRQEVDANRNQYDDFVMSHEITWSSDQRRLTSEYWDVISNRVQEERAWGLAAPPVLFWRNSLRGQQNVFLIYKGIGAILSTLVILACLAAIIWAIVGSGGGALPVIIINLTRLKPLVSTLKLVAVAVLVLLAMDMDVKLQYTVAPAVKERHQEALTELQSLAVQSAQQKGVEPQLQLQTKLYSVDGRLLELQTYSPSTNPGAQSTAFHLPPGAYRTVTSAPVIGNLGSDAQVRVFEVAGPQVALDLALGTSQLGISETLQANIWVTNTDTLTGTGPLALVVEASDGDNGDAWVVELDSQGHQQFDLSFVPPEAGSYILRAQLFGPDGALLGLREAGYVVGSGPALALELSCQDTWLPGETVTAHITATNSGNEVVHNLLDVVTWDQESQQPSYTTTLSLNLTAGASESHTVNVLAGAQPGRYSVNLLLDGEGYMSWPFVVAAENTLLVVVEATPQYGAIGQPIETAIEVVDMTYAPTDATVTAYVVDPLFAAHSISVSHAGEGLYSTSYTPTLSGAHEIFVTAARENWRGDSATTTFVAQQASHLASTVAGNPQVGQLHTVTIAVHNEHTLPVMGALVTISGTQEYINRTTDTSGQAVFPLLPPDSTPYQVWIEKTGYATTRFEIAVDLAQIYLPLVLRNH